MKTKSRILFLSIFVLVLTALMTVTAFAATPGTGYTVNSSGEATCIKWTMDESGVLTFEIDPSATDKVQTTVINNRDPITGEVASWSGGLTTYKEATKIIIGDGITEVSGFAALYSLVEVEIPTSLTTLGTAAFQCSGNLQSVYVRGTEPVYGLFDLTYITKLSAYIFDGVYRIGTVVMNPDFADVIPTEAFKGTGIFDFNVPAGTTVIENRAFAQTAMLKSITIQGMDTVITSDAVFADSDSYPQIKAKAGSKAAEYALANEYTFVDLDSGATTTGAKGELANQPVVTKPQITDFNHDGATLWGHLSGKYMGTSIINTWWAYYDDTKTLEFVSATTAYNETGMVSNVDAEYTDWFAYKDQIEHIIIGEHISKITGGQYGGAFTDYTALKDVRISKGLGQIDANAFSGCTSLTTIWVEGTERVEGKADLSNISTINDAFNGTAIREYIFHDNVKALPEVMSPCVSAIYVAEATEELINFAKSNFCDLICRNDPTAEHKYYVYIDPTLPTCGLKAAFGFDAATGTLTVYGAGIIDDVVNYYGGGSKNAPWFSIKHQVKHIVISDAITTIGKYAFCEFSNLETVQIPNSDSFMILNAAFEKCSNLKSIYRAGEEPIEGTIDLSNVHEINSWTFASDYLIANVVLSPNVSNIGSSVFDSNPNLANIYCTPGTYAEEYASENGLSFYDISSSVPQPITCTPPDTDSGEESSTASESVTDTESADSMTETDPPLVFVDENVSGKDSDGSLHIGIIIGAAVIAAAVVIAVVIIFIKKKKNK